MLVGTNKNRASRWDFRTGSYPLVKDGKSHDVRWFCDQNLHFFSGFLIVTVDSPCLFRLLVGNMTFESMGFKGIAQEIWLLDIQIIHETPVSEFLHSRVKLQEGHMNISNYLSISIYIYLSVYVIHTHIYIFILHIQLYIRLYKTHIFMPLYFQAPQQMRQDRLFLTSMQCRQLVGVFGDSECRMAVRAAQRNREWGWWGWWGCRYINI